MEREESVQHFLDLIKKSRRGKFKIYIGMIAGVGKTYRMLQEARELLDNGVDVRIGYVETHGRAGTEAMLEGLPVISRRKIFYKGKELEEMDLETIIRIHPEIVVVDELAHTNVEGSLNEKRWQDVMTLLDEGINVISAINIQHIESVSELENRIDSLLNGKKATVGIAVWTDKGDMLRYNDHVHFPLLSVFKFHVALAVLDKMDKQSISLDSIVSIKASQMPPNTYSPLRKKFPDQDFTITLRELMQYSISQSDNNACDILIEYAGGIKHINDYIHRLSIDSFNLSETEDGMHSSFEAVYRNWSTPSAMVRLLRTADEKELFSNKELKDFLWQTMIDTETGANKLKGMLPAKTVVGHKTGSSDRNADGMKTADNDAGLVILPDGRKYYIAAFVMDSYETDEDNANIIARISRMVYDAMR